jgi:predicted SAM-dependent methyltransferase
MKFKLLRLALEYCQGEGIEIGGASHNPYGVRAKNIAPRDDKEFAFYQKTQEGLGEPPLPVDIWAEGDDLPLEDNSQDFVLASHVMEHMPNPIKALFEWHRVVKPEGIIFLVIPQPTACPGDVGRPLTTLEHCLEDYRLNRTIEDHPIPPGHGRRGHYHVWNLAQFSDLVNQVFPDKLTIVATQDPDEKVGNGFVVVLRKKCKADTPIVATSSLHAGRPNGQPVNGYHKENAGLVPRSNLRIDLGCGSCKKPGTLGVDIQSIPGVDHAVDLDKNPLPFEDNSVAYVHSSHFLPPRYLPKSAEYAATAPGSSSGLRTRGPMTPSSLRTKPSSTKRTIYTCATFTLIFTRACSGDAGYSKRYSMSFSRRCFAN